VDDHRKDAKALLRAFRGGEPEALRRAERVLGERARTRFLLSDAQHVVAVEQGFRSWPELKRQTERVERIADTGLAYAPGDPVRVRVVRRGTRTWIGDDGAAVARGGRPAGWREAARLIEDDLVVNVSRQGVVWLPVVGRGPDEETIVRRIGEASLALYQELLELGPQHRGAF
jgi:hypothetical protein